MRLIEKVKSSGKDNIDFKVVVKAFKTTSFMFDLLNYKINAN